MVRTKQSKKSKTGKFIATEEGTSQDEIALIYPNGLRLKVVNNLVDNAIRPLALDRKNYLFAGSHEAAQRAAMIYSFFAICKKHEVNPYNWLKYTLENIQTINHKSLKDLYPQNYKKIAEQSKM